MTSAQAPLPEQQGEAIAAGASQTENNQHKQTGPTALQQDGQEQGEPMSQVNSCQCSNTAQRQPEPEADSKPQTDAAVSATQSGQQPNGGKHGLHDGNVHGTSGKEEGTAPLSQEGKASSPESAQSRARRLALEASEAQEAAQQAAKLAVEKQLQALAAAKEAEDEIQAEREADKEVALRGSEKVAERARKQQKLSAEPSQEVLQELLQTTLANTLPQVAEQEVANAQPKATESSEGAIGPEGDVEKATPETPARDGGPNSEQPMSPAQRPEQRTGPETATQAAAHQVASEQAPEATQPSVPEPVSNGTQEHTPELNATVAQNPFVNPEAAATRNLGIAGDVFLGKAPESEPFRVTPENQPSDQGPTPMQVG